MYCNCGNMCRHCGKSNKMATPVDQMPRLDLVKDAPQLTQAHLDYMKKIEEVNRERVQALQKLKKRNKLTGAVIAGTVFGIYLYSIFAVKQETFLDELDEPTTKSKQ